jgi:hypothetical protein
LTGDVPDGSSPERRHLRLEETVELLESSGEQGVGIVPQRPAPLHFQPHRGFLYHGVRSAASSGERDRAEALVVLGRQGAGGQLLWALTVRPGMLEHSEVRREHVMEARVTQARHHLMAHEDGRATQQRGD